MTELEHDLRGILTPELFLASYRLKCPFQKGCLPSGAVVGGQQFGLDTAYLKALYDLTFHKVLVPLSKIPLEQLLDFDLTKLLPRPDTPDYPEQALGLIHLIDQSRNFMEGYSRRYTNAFFDPLCDKLARQLISLPHELRVDGKQAWLSRGYTVDDWAVRTLWIWAPLIHSGSFMASHRQEVKDWLHSVRAEVEAHAGATDPFASLEAKDDSDLTIFKDIMVGGPPQKSYVDPDREATVADYDFWWIRIINAHFAITDYCGHYPFWARWKGYELSEKDREWFAVNENWLYDPSEEPVLQEIRKDHLHGVWKPLQPNPRFEEGAPRLVPATLA